MCGHLMNMMRCFDEQPAVDYNLLSFHLRTSPAQAMAMWNTLKNKYNLHKYNSFDGGPPEGGDLVLIMSVIACMYEQDQVRCWTHPAVLPWHGFGTDDAGMVVQDARWRILGFLYGDFLGMEPQHQTMLTEEESYLVGDLTVQSFPSRLRLKP
ncbi:hypothetical protein EKO27_g4828 [Xylaria grammica]|uniref:Uncharacterized protein n=1 Tax=Xylaria grammica TaxID=363999 RepID=A0A439D784_9PEZI|nr:hypothetical protein EKO27_g4828 [Xylaria grammica]